ncbi:uncharacterized protein ACWYII_013273 [Salvelinus alpinus]
MNHPKLWRALLFMTVLYQFGTSNRYGCVFERRLCSREQFCSDDGLFGQCRTSKQDQMQYQVSVPVLKRMQEVLKQLMLQGLSWQDDITQYVVAKELSRVPHTTQSLKASSFSQTKQSSSNQGGYPSRSSNQGGYPSSSSSQGGYPSSSSNQGGYPSSSSSQRGYPSSSSNQGGYPSSSSNQGGYPSSSSNQGGYPSSSSSQGGYPSSSSSQGGYPSSSSNQGGYPSSSSSQGGYPSSSSNQGGYPSSSSSQRGYPSSSSNQGGYPSSSSSQGGYPSSSSSQGGYPSSSSNQGGYPSSSSSQRGYPSSSSNQGGYPSSSSNQGGYPSSSSNQGGYPSSSSSQGGYPSSSSKQGGYPSSSSSQGGYPSSSSKQGGYPSSSSKQGGYPSSSSSQGGYPSSSSKQGGYPSSSSSQGGYPSSSSNQGGYPSSSSSQGGYPSSSSKQGGYPSSSASQRGYPSSSSKQGGYPSSSASQGGYPSSSSKQGGYPSSSSSQGGYPSSSSNQGGYPSSSSKQGGYPSSSASQRGYPSSSSKQGGYPSSSASQGGYPSSSTKQGGYPSSSSSQGGYPSSSTKQGGYPSSSSSQGEYPSSSSKSGASQADSHQDYLIVDHLQSPLRMQTSPMDLFSYQQHRYQEGVERSLHQGGGVYAGLRPSRYQQAKQRERDRQLLQDVISLYLSSSPAQPSFRHRGAAALPAPPYYEEPELPLDYVENYSLTELAMARARQQQQQQQLPQQDYSSLATLDESILQRMVETLERYGVDPRELTPQQLYRLAVVLQLMQAEDHDNIDPLTDDPKTQQVLKSSDTVPKKGEKAPVLVPRPSSAPGPKVVPTLAPAATSPPLTAPLGGSVTAKDSSVSVEDVKGKVKSSNVPAGLPAAEGGTAAREEYGYIVTNQSPLSLYNGVKLLGVLAERIHLTTSSFINISVVGPALTFRIRQNPQNMSAEDMAEKAASQKSFLESETGLKILQTGVGERSEGHGLAHATRVREGSSGLVLALVSMACVSGVVVVALTIACLRHHAKQLASGKLGLGPGGGPETHVDYQELCRQHKAAKTSLSRQEAVGVGAGGRRGTDTSRVSSVSSQFSDGPQHSTSSHSSTPSWSEEPAQSNMDISTGHMILAYMEDHLEKKDRLLKEWEDLCSYQAEPSAVTVAQSESHLEKNRCLDSLPYNHSRVKLKAESNSTKEDYINASTIIDHDPRLPAYIATQGPLAHTIADFWQTVWENGCTVIVMMTALVEDGEIQCVRYWPDEGSSLYHIYEVNLVSEHIWCKDFLVRSFYLKNVQTQETRTLTQFHLLSWPANGIPTSTRPLLDFRRKVNKCYRGRSCPIIVHCSDGIGRTGTYILIDMVLNRMAKGVKEIDIAATLEHIRDQRPNLVRTKDQFEFALTAVAEEVNAILKALPQ